MYVRNTLHIPNRYNSIVIKKKDTNVVMLYNKTKKITLPLNPDKSIWSFDCENKSIVGLGNAINYQWGKMMNVINHKMFIFESMFFEKITFKGKGFKLTSKKKKLIFYIFYSDTLTWKLFF